MRELGQGVWLVERGFKMLGAEFGNRMTIIRLVDGDLLLHSPVAWDEALAAQVRQLGKVRYLLTPNLFHGAHVAAWQAAFPEAQHCAVSGWQGKSALTHTEINERLRQQWLPELETLVVGGIEKLNELACFHPASRTLILTDLCFNIPRSRTGWSRFFFSLNHAYGRFGPTRLMRSLIDDREALRLSIEQILNWDFERIVVAHGDAVESDGRAAMRQAFDFLLQEPSLGGSRMARFPIRCG